jgi:2-polyprenyl-3-methyl-5-hydroxy-6-metoxy-1,4-benzoquinol methylase
MRTAKHSNWEIKAGPPCLSCGGRQFIPLFTASDFDGATESFCLLECEKCHLVRTEPILSDAQLQKYYSLPYYGGGREKFKGFTENLTRWFNSFRAGSILSHMPGNRISSKRCPPKVLDIGCGRGRLLEILKQKGCDCYGLERKAFPVNTQAQGIHFYKENLRDIRFEDDFFDAVILWHVLEHIENPVAMIHETARIIRPAGIIALAVPNFGSIQARLFRSAWFHLDLPRHTHHFNPQTLRQCLEQNGLKVIKKHTFSIEQNPFGFIQSLLNKISPLSKPNRFYSLLKKQSQSNFSFNLLCWAGLAALILPVALLEYLVSGILRRGATLTVYAEKR